MKRWKGPRKDGGGKKSFSETVGQSYERTGKRNWDPLKKKV